LPVEEFLFNLFGFGFIGGDLRVNLLLVCEIVGESRVHSGGREVLVLTDDVFSAVAEPLPTAGAVGYWYIVGFADSGEKLN